MKSKLQLSKLEKEMFKEVFEVMSKYKVKREFALQLVHSHFPIKEGEILYETHNIKKRTLKITPKQISRFSKVPLATAWHKNKTGKIEVSMLCCDSVIRP